MSDVRKRSRAPRVPFALLVGGLIVGGLVLLLALNTASAANELRRGELAGQDQEVSADLAQLRNEVAASAAPGNLARAAQALGMVPAGNPAFIVELPDGRTVLRGHAKAAADDPLVLPTGTPHATPSTSPSTPSSTSSTTGTTSASATRKAPTTTSSTSTHRTGRAHGTHRTHRKGRRHAATNSPPATPTSPTSTPTPTITLSGGNR